MSSINKNKKIVLLLDGQTVQATAIAEYLKKSGCYIISFCDSNNSYGYHTKFVDKKILSPKSKTKGIYLSFLIDFLHDNKVDVIIPMNDDSATFLSENKNLLSNEKARFIIPDKDIFFQGFDKNQLMKLCHKNDFPHPRTADLSEVTTKEACSHVGFPAIIKPNITTGGRGMQMIRTESQLSDILNPTINEYGDCHLQEFIQPGGKQFKVQIYRDHLKNEIYSTVIEKMRYYPEKGGSSCFNKTIYFDELVQLCNSVLIKLKWDGFADFDLIEDPSDGIIKIMEINPRVPACIKSSLVSGIDFALIILNKSLDMEIPPMKYEPNKYLRYIALDLLWFIYSPNRFKTKPNWFIFFGKNLFYQDFTWKDLRPFIFGFLGGLLKQFNPKFRKSKKGLRV